MTNTELTLRLKETAGAVEEARLVLHCASEDGLFGVEAAEEDDTEIFVGRAPEALEVEVAAGSDGKPVEEVA